MTNNSFLTPAKYALIECQAFLREYDGISQEQISRIYSKVKSLRNEIEYFEIKEKTNDD